MVMPGRKYSATSYRYGFNGKENDPETVGTGQGTQDYGMRIYNPALGRFLSVDPITDEYPELTPYQFASNRPIEGIDKDGLEFCRYDCDSYDPNVKQMAEWDHVTNYRDSKNYQIFNEARSDFSGGTGIIEGMLGGALGEGLVSLGKYFYNSYKASKTIQKVVQAEKIIVKAEQGMTKIKSVFQAAKEGGKNSGLYKQYLSKPIEQIQKGIKSFTKQIDHHKNLIDDVEYRNKYLSAEKAKDPTKKLWGEMSEQQQKNQLGKWEGEVKTYSEQKEVLEGIAKEKKP